MMWIDGVSPQDVVHAYGGAVVALLVFGVPAALQQQRYSPILEHEHVHVHVDWPRVAIVALILVSAIITNVIINVKFPAWSDTFPFIGLSVTLALLVSTLWRRPDWEIIPETVKSSIFLLSLVLSATLMPVERLPSASWQTALILGFISAVFDNIPLTALALRQGGYDWGMLAYTVGFGGSMMWFGSSAGVAISNVYPEAKSAGLWLKQGWHVIVAYIVGFVALLTVVGWDPHPTHKGLAPPLPLPAARLTLPRTRWLDEAPRWFRLAENRRPNSQTSPAAATYTAACDHHQRKNPPICVPGVSRSSARTNRNRASENSRPTTRSADSTRACHTGRSSLSAQYVRRQP